MENISLNDQVETQQNESPAYWNLINIRDEKDDINDEFKEKLRNQLNFKDLDEHLFQNYNPTNYNTLASFLYSVHRDIIGITNIEQLLLDADRTVLFSYFIYEILFFDVPGVYIPKIIEKFQLRSINAIYNMEYSEFKDKLQNVLLDISKILDIQKEMNLELSREKFKLSVAIDLLDNDMEDFFEDFVLNILTKDYNG